MIVTYYSYKGGVGRTLALANIACLMAADEDHPQKVLVWDFDLEAPSLHKLFPPIKPQKYGFVDFAYDFAETGEIPDINDYIYESATDNVFVLPASGKIDNSYCTKLQSINWLSFFGSEPTERGPFFTAILNALNNRKEDAFDYILVDSRTGLNDQAGICTEVLSDLLVILFRLSEQNFDGLDHLVPVIKSQLKKRNKEDVSMLPIASQVGLASSQSQVGEYRRHAEEIFQEELFYIRFDQDLVNNEHLLCLPDEIEKLWPIPPIVEDYKNICTKIRKKNGNDSRTLENQLKKSLRQDDETTVIQQIKKLLLKRPFLPRPWLALLDYDVSPEKSDREELKNIVDDIIEKYDNNHFAFRWYGEYHLSQAQDINSKELQNAIERFQKALECASESESEQVPILRKLSKIKTTLGDLDDAINLLKKAKSVFPDNNQIGLDLSFLYIRKGSNYFTLACQELESVSEKISDRNWYLVYLYAFLGEKEKVSELFKKLDEEDGGRYGNGLQKAYALLLEGNKDEAMKLVPKNIYGTGDISNWAEFYLCSMEYEKGLELFDKYRTNREIKEHVSEYEHIEILIKFFSQKTEIKKEEVVKAWKNSRSWNFRELIFFKELCLKKNLNIKRKLDVIDILLNNQDFNDLKSKHGYRHGGFRVDIDVSRMDFGDD
jgi:MinD-like ATPase involved in chromosome partitioning or flagellar assembly/tetratricopeptide (TPR) repeat protein